MQRLQYFQFFEEQNQPSYRCRNLQVIFFPQWPYQETFYKPANKIIIVQMNAQSTHKLIKSTSKKGNEYFLSKIRREMNANQQKISRSVYNLESRNIKQFTKQWMLMKKKMNASQQPKQLKYIAEDKYGKRYDDNKLLQLDFKQPRIPSRLSLQRQDREDSVITVKNRTTEDNAMSSRYAPFKRSVRYKLTFKVKDQVASRESLSRELQLRKKSKSLMREGKDQIRKRMLTQWDSPSKKPLSRLSLHKGQSASVQYQSADEYLINVNQQKMQRFIRNLHRLQWLYTFIKKNPQNQCDQSNKQVKIHMRKFQYDLDSPIDQHAINYMINRRYKLNSRYLEDTYEQNIKKLSDDATNRQRKKIAQSSQYPFLSSLSANSILNLIDKNIDYKKNKIQSERTPHNQQTDKNAVTFQLPHSQFISYRETKNSIYQLVRMGLKAGLKIAFSIYDKNKNGVIDEDDLLQFIGLSRKIPMLQADISIISKAMISFKDIKKSFFNKNKLQSNNLKQQRIMREKSLSIGKQSQQFTHINSIKEEEQNQLQSQDNENAQKPLSSSRFSIDRLYTFLKQREKQKNKSVISKKQKTNLQPLNFFMFSKVFQFKRPFIIYDLFQFIFGANTEDFKEDIQKHIQQTLRTINNQQKIDNSSLYQEETIQQKWNKRLKNTNAILQSFIHTKQKTIE